MGFILKIDEELCQGCGNCIVVCPVSALSDNSVAGGSGSGEKKTFGVETGAVEIYDPEFCTGCGTCVDACGYGAIEIEGEEPQELETRLKPEQLWMTGDKADVYQLIREEGPLTIEQISEKLDLSPKLVSSSIVSLKTMGVVFEGEKLEEDHRVGYTYTTEPPRKEEEEEEEEALEISVDPEKAKEMREALEKAMSSFSTPKVKVMMESGKLDKVKEEIANKLEKR